MDVLQPPHQPMLKKGGATTNGIPPSKFDIGVNGGVRKCSNLQKLPHRWMPGHFENLPHSFGLKDICGVDWVADIEYLPCDDNCKDVADDENTIVRFKFRMADTDTHSHCADLRYCDSKKQSVSNVSFHMLDLRGVMIFVTHFSLLSRTPGTANPTELNWGPGIIPVTRIQNGTPELPILQDISVLMTYNNNKSDQLDAKFHSAKFVRRDESVACWSSDHTLSIENVPTRLRIVQGSLGRSNPGVFVKSIIVNGLLLDASNEFVIGANVSAHVQGCVTDACPKGTPKTSARMDVTLLRCAVPGA